jgi:hypothetical protein
MQKGADARPRHALDPSAHHRTLLEVLEEVPQCSHRRERDKWVRVLCVIDEVLVGVSRLGCPVQGAYPWTRVGLRSSEPR